MKPELLAVRSVNEYRKRDILPYVGLRYFFANDCAVRDRWAMDVAAHLVVSRTEPAYFETKHFKDFDEDSSVRHRQILLPGPNEAFAEAGLLAECSRHEAFQSSPKVYSYRLAQGAERSGVFIPYFSGFRELNKHVARICHERPNSVVLYTDIKKFYPSIRAELAVAAWKKACDASQISSFHRELGEKLLSDHRQIAADVGAGQSILTGPMFSHLIANLVLQPIDLAMQELLPDGYFRYVDDIILVGTEEEVGSIEGTLSNQLSDMSLELHPSESGKRSLVAAPAWLAGTRDFSQGENSQWMKLVGSIKNFLLANHVERVRLAEALFAEGFRIPIPEYEQAAKESSYLQRVGDNLRKYPWLRLSIRRLSIANIMDQALKARSTFAARLRTELPLHREIEGYERKRKIQALRYLAGRLVYLGTPDMLIEFSGAFDEIPELALLARVMRAVAQRDVTDLLSLGHNAVQSAAQVMRLTKESVTCSREDWGQVECQSLAILRLNNISVELPGPPPIGDELLLFSEWGESAKSLMRSKDPFIRELACLHGATELGRHAAMLDTAFDRDEILAFDLLSQLHQSSYF